MDNNQHDNYIIILSIKKIKLKNNIHLDSKNLKIAVIENS